MHEPDARFQQLLLHDRVVGRHIGRVDRHFPRRVFTGRTCRTQYFVCACSAMTKDSLAQSIGFERVQLSTLAGVIDFNRSVAASPTSAPTALVTR